MKGPVQAQAVVGRSSLTIAPKPQGLPPAAKRHLQIALQNLENALRIIRRQAEEEAKA